MKQKLKALLAVAFGAALISPIDASSAAELPAAETTARTNSLVIPVIDQRPGAPQQSVPGRSMFCQIDGRGNAPEYCQVTARAEGDVCLCRRKLPGGATGATNAPGRATLSPKGRLW